VLFWQFASILVLLIVTSLGIAVRAVYFRRRFRNSVNRAIERGDIPAEWGTPGTAGLYDYGWWRTMGVNRFFGVDPDADDLHGFMMGDWGNTATGRRRKPKKDYGEPPDLYEVELEQADDMLMSQDSESSWSEKQASRRLLCNARLATKLIPRTASRYSRIQQEPDTNNSPPYPEQST
jgi:hypothetical protein